MPYVYVDTYNEMLQKEYSLNKKVNSMTEEMEKLKQDVNNLAEYNADLKK